MTEEAPSTTTTAGGNISSQENSTTSPRNSAFFTVGVFLQPSREGVHVELQQRLADEVAEKVFSTAKRPGAFNQWSLVYPKGRQQQQGTTGDDEEAEDEPYHVVFFDLEKGAATQKQAEVLPLLDLIVAPTVEACMEILTRFKSSVVDFYQIPIVCGGSATTEKKKEDGETDKRQALFDEVKVDYIHFINSGDASTIWKYVTEASNKHSEKLAQEDDLQEEKEAEIRRDLSVARMVKVQRFSKIKVTHMKVVHGELRIGDRISGAAEVNTLHPSNTVVSMRNYLEGSPVEVASKGMHIAVQLESDLETQAISGTSDSKIKWNSTLDVGIKNSLKERTMDNAVSNFSLMGLANILEEVVSVPIYCVVELPEESSKVIQSLKPSHGVFLEGWGGVSLYHVAGISSKAKSKTGKVRVALVPDLKKNTTVINFFNPSVYQRLQAKEKEPKPIRILISKENQPQVQEVAEVAAVLDRLSLHRKCCELMGDSPLSGFSPGSVNETTSTTASSSTTAGGGGISAAIIDRRATVTSCLRGTHPMFAMVEQAKGLPLVTAALRGEIVRNIANGEDLFQVSPEVKDGDSGKILEREASPLWIRRTKDERQANKAAYRKVREAAKKAAFAGEEKKPKRAPAPTRGRGRGGYTPARRVKRKNGGYRYYGGSHYRNNRGRGRGGFRGRGRGGGGTDGEKKEGEQEKEEEEEPEKPRVPPPVTGKIFSLMNLLSWDTEFYDVGLWMIRTDAKANVVNCSSEGYYVRAIAESCSGGSKVKMEKVKQWLEKQPTKEKKATVEKLFFDSLFSIGDAGRVMEMVQQAPEKLDIGTMKKVLSSERMPSYVLLYISLYSSIANARSMTIANMSKDMHPTTAERIRKWIGPLYYVKKQHCSDNFSVRAAALRYYITWALNISPNNYVARGAITGRTLHKIFLYLDCDIE